MFKKWKKIIAAVLSSAMILTCGGCTMGKDTANALTVDGYQVKAGVYIYYSYMALNEAKNEAKKQDENLDTDNNSALEKVTLDGKSFMDYVKEKATKRCVDHVATIKHFNELGLSLTEEQEDKISEYVDSAWDSNKEMYEKNGIGKESLKEIMALDYKSDEIFNAYYGENGSEGVTNDDLKEYYIANNARVRYIDMDLHDSEGNELDAAGKKEIRDMANDFLRRAQKAENEEKMLEEFNNFQEEYDKYVSDKAAEASGEEESGEAVTTTTTAAATTAPTTTTTISAENSELQDEELQAEIERLKEELEQAEAEAAAAAEDEKEEAEKKAEEAQKALEEAEKKTESSSSEPASTTAPENDDSDETTTTTSIHDNESIIHVITTKEDTKEEDISYNPSKKTYEWIFNDSTKFGVPELIEEEDTLYVIVKFDIADRTTEDDLWTEYNTEVVRYEMFNDKMQDIIKGWGEEYEIVKNEKAYNRYNPFDVKFD